MCFHKLDSVPQQIQDQRQIESAISMDGKNKVSVTAKVEWESSTTLFSFRSSMPRNADTAKAVREFNEAMLSAHKRKDKDEEGRAVEVDDAWAFVHAPCFLDWYDVGWDRDDEQGRPQENKPHEDMIRPFLKSDSDYMTTSLEKYDGHEKLPPGANPFILPSLVGNKRAGSIRFQLILTPGLACVFESASPLTYMGFPKDYSHFKKYSTGETVALQNTTADVGVHRFIHFLAEDEPKAQMGKASLRVSLEPTSSLGLESKETFVLTDEQKGSDEKLVAAVSQELEKVSKQFNIKLGLKMNDDHTFAFTFPHLSTRTYVSYRLSPSLATRLGAAKQTVFWNTPKFKSVLAPTTTTTAQTAATTSSTATAKEADDVAAADALIVREIGNLYVCCLRGPATDYYPGKLLVSLEPTPAGNFKIIESKHDVAPPLLDGDYLRSVPNGLITLSFFKKDPTNNTFVDFDPPLPMRFEGLIKFRTCIDAAAAAQQGF